MQLSDEIRTNIIYYLSYAISEDKKGGVFLLRYLLYNGLYKRYLANVIESHVSRKYNFYPQLISIEDAFMNGFGWMGTDEGTGFWGKVQSFYEDTLIQYRERKIRPNKHEMVPRHARHKAMIESILRYGID